MLVYDFNAIGNRLLDIRKKRGLTQFSIAERAGISERTYADIERGSANMRLETLLRICNAFNITPNDILIDDSDDTEPITEDVCNRLSICDSHEQVTALKILNAYLESL